MDTNDLLAAILLQLHDSATSSALQADRIAVDASYQLYATYTVAGLLVLMVMLMALSIASRGGVR